MKHSIRNIFKNLTGYLFFLLFVAFLALMVVAEQQLSFDKIETLTNDKSLIKEIVNSHEKDKELALIQLNAQNIKLLQSVEKLHLLYKYNILEKLLLQNNTEYMQSLDKLTLLIKNFNQVTHKYYTKNALQEEHLQAFKALNGQLNKMLFQAMQYNHKKFELIKYLVVVIFFLVFLATFWYKRVLKAIYADINYLFQINKTNPDYTIYSMEADAIALRMNRKSPLQENPNFIDPVTGINNYKGLLNAYSHKKSLKSSNYTSVTILEIDNFSKSKHVFPQEIVESMLKKVAYTISLNEQPIDVIARTDYNQFTLIFSRPTKEQAFKEIDLIRESIAELKFHIPNKGAVQVTVSGGFLIKPSNTSIEEALKQANKILEYAKSIGKNKILQMRDFERKAR